MPGFAAQPRDATLDALAALAWSSGTQVPALTAADTVSLITVGTAANNLVRLDGSAKLPAVDGSALTNLPSSGKLAQVVSTLSGAVQTGTTTTPWDDTIPQSSEGTEFYTRAITPTNASSSLVILAKLDIAGSTSGPTITLALHRDSDADAIAAAQVYMAATNQSQTAVLLAVVSAGSTTARTYKLRAGASSAATLTVNGSASARKLGGALCSGIVILEVLP